MHVRSGHILISLAFGALALLLLAEPAKAQQEGNEPITFEANGDQPTFAEPRSAEDLFAIYSAADQYFDAGVVILYADEARILHTRRYPNGQVRKVEFPIDQWKTLIVQTMPLAKELNDTSTYSQIRFAQEGKRIRIRAVRYNARKDYESPFQLLVGQNAAGLWRIYEEVSESRP